MKNLARAIIYTHCEEHDRLLTDAFVISGLSAKSVTEAHDAEVLHRLILRPGLTYLVLSDELGIFQLNKTLEYIANKGMALSKHVLIITKKENTTLASLAMEYGVTEVYTGDCSKDGLRGAVSRLIDNVPISNEMNKYLEEVAGYLEQNDLDKAIKCFEAAIRDSKGDSEKLRINIAELYLQNNQLKKAKRTLEPLQLNSNKNSKLFYVLARIALKEGNKNEAFEYFEMCQFISPNNIVQLLDIGNQYLKVGEDNAAKAVYEDVIQLDASNLVAEEGLGTVALISGDVEKGLKLLNSTINLREKCSFFNTAAIVNVKRENYDRAFDLYSNALKIAGRDHKLVSSICFNIGLLFYKKKNVKYAEKYFEKSLKYNPAHKFAAHNIDAIKTSIHLASSKSSESKEITFLDVEEADFLEDIDHEALEDLDSLIA